MMNIAKSWSISSIANIRSIEMKCFPITNIAKIGILYASYMNAK